MNDDLTRRRFLQGTVSIAATIAAARVALGQQEEQRKPQEKEPEPAATKPTPYNQINLAFIGANGNARSTIKQMAGLGANVAALCDVDSNRLGEVAADYPKARNCIDFRKMLEKQKDIDAVIVSTPDHTHATAAMMAMKLGKHCYCEKPLTHNIAEARKLARTARRCKVATQMGNQGHASEGSRRQVEWIRSGVLGPIKEVHIWTDRPVWPQGLRRPKDRPSVPPSIDWDLWLGPAPRRPYHPSYHPFAWRGWWDFGTGALGDMACHLMDSAYWALDLRDPRSVEAFSDGGTNECGPNWSIVKYEFPRRGDRAALNLFWYDGGILPHGKLMKGKPHPGGDNGMIFVGENATMAAPLNGEPILVDDEQAQQFKPPEKSIEPSAGHHQEWLDAILGGKPAGANFDYSGPFTEMVLLSTIALRTGKRIEWDGNRITNSDSANQYVSREYRKGWEL